MMKMVRNLRFVAPAVGVMFLAFILVLSAACRGGDQIAPDKSTITLAANPATIVLVVGGCSCADVVATVSSAVGVPLKDQDVRFSSTAGSLTVNNEPAANVPIRTDDLGNAHVLLTTTTTTTVTARSGTATGTLSLSTVNGNLSSILINQNFSGAGCMSDNNFKSCNDKLCLTAQAVDNQGDGISGVVIAFALENVVTSKGDPITGTFSPAAQTTTDSGGFASASFQIGSSTCSSVCTAPETCSGDLVASLQGGGFPSTPPVHFTSSIP